MENKRNYRKEGRKRKPTPIRLRQQIQAELLELYKDVHRAEARISNVEQGKQE